MELNIKDFDDLEQYFKRKQQHTEELEQENTELTIENRKLHQEIDRLRRSQAEYVNQILNKKSPAATEDEITKYFNDISIPHEMRGREVR